MTRTRQWTDPMTRPVLAATVPGTGLEVEVTPTAEERIAMARALDLASVDRLKAKYRLTHRSGGIIVLDGTLEADIQPVCVVSLEPFPLRVSETVEMRFIEEAAASRRKPRPGEEEDVSGDDPPDVMEHGIIDLGHVTTEFLSLSLPIYPRKPGAAFEKTAEESEKSPFDALRALKKGE